ncbi:HTH domain-containing protein [bacterium SCSIO 12741]|nr:HTH domain-containing protein [bacterium SCSIO 12741]
MEFNEAKQKFIQTWGTFGSGWGINRTMAQIHALLLVSHEALSTEEIMEELNISRGNANMNIRALIEWGIVFKELKAGERKEYFYTGKDIWALARQIASERKRREIEPVVSMIEQLEQFDQEPEAEEQAEFIEMLGNIKSFTIQANGLVDKFTRSDQHWFYKNLLKLVK